MFPIRDNIPTDRLPVVTMALIAINCIAYFFWQRGGITLGDPHSSHYLTNLIQYAAIPNELAHPGTHCGYAVTAQGADANHVVCSGLRYPISQPSTFITPFTAMFMHGGLLHLGGNMLFLWIFGNNVEDSMGPVRYVLFYVLGGLAAVALQTAVDPSAAVPTIGASGAIAGVLGGYLILYPRAKVVTLIFIIFFFTILELPALFFLGIWFVQQAIFSALDLTNPTGSGGGVAYFAHVGGFVFGIGLIKLFATRRSSAADGPRFPVY